MNLTFRDATLDDLPVIVGIYNSTVAGRMVTADTEEVSAESRIPWFNVHEPKHRPLWVVEKERDIIGWVSFQSFYGRPAYQGTAEISIYLSEKARGFGFGKRVLNYAMDACERLEIKTLLAFIFLHNQVSISLFTNAGFEEWAHFPKIAILDGIEREVLILGKRVNR